MRGESQAGQNAIRKNAEIVTERDIQVMFECDVCNLVEYWASDFVYLTKFREF